MGMPWGCPDGYLGEEAVLGEELGDFRREDDVPARGRKRQVRVWPSAARRGGGRDRGLGLGDRPVLEGVVEVLLGVLDLAHVRRR
jgi:hypothetical protein